MTLKVAKRVWRDKWEVILAMIGIIATTFGAAEWYWRVVWGAVGVLLLIDIAGAVISEASLCRDCHVPLIVFVPSREIGDEGTVLDAYSEMIAEAADPVRRAGFDESKYVARFGVTQDEWALRLSSPLTRDPTEWQQVVRRFNARVYRLAHKLGGRHIFHVFLRCPATLALGLGAVLGTHHRLTLYHHQPGGGRGPYVRVVDASGRAGSLRVSLGKDLHRPYEIIALERPVGEAIAVDALDATALSQGVYVSVFLSRHDPASSVEALARAAGADAVHVRKASPGALTDADDWLAVARELADLLLRLVARGDVSRVHVALSCPVPIAFATGLALGTQSAVTVYNWFSDQQALLPVLALDHLERSQG